MFAVSPSSEERTWRRTLWLMVAVQFIVSASLTVQSPMLPLFLLQIGVEKGGAVEFWAGVLNSVNFLIAALVSPIWGSIGDRYGRKMMVLRSSLAICIFMALMGLSQSLWQLVMLRALMGMFSGFSATAIALVATQVPENRLGFSLGWLSTGQLVGALFGPVLGGIIADASGSYRFVFFCTSALAAIAVTLAWLFVKERFTPVRERDRPSIVSNFRLLAASGLLPLFAVLAMAQFGVRTVQPVVTLFVEQLTGPVPALATLAGFAFSVTGISDVLFSPFLGKRSDMLGYRRVLLISLFGAALVSIPQALVDSYWQFVAFRFAVGMFVGGLVPTANALVGRMVEPARRGVAYGVTASAGFLGSFLGPITGGSLAASFGLRSVFLVTGLMFLVNFVWVYFVVPVQVPDRRPLNFSPADADADARPAEDEVRPLDPNLSADAASERTKEHGSAK